MQVTEMKLLKADEGKVLINGKGSYGYEICVSAEEAENWQEVDEKTINTEVIETETIEETTEK